MSNFSGSFQFKYFAFISYNSKDTIWGKRLQRKLEGYRMPTTLCNEYGWNRNPIRPVFFAPTDIQPGGLTEELQARLRASRHLIVICSPNSAKSEWVGKEIEYFHSLGRPKNIHLFIVNGTPHNVNPELRCYNPILEKIGMGDVLGANINEKISNISYVNREHAYVQLITKLLGVEFDSIWQRHKRQLIQKCIVWVTSIVIVLGMLISSWILNLPVEVSVHLKEVSEQNNRLPPLQDAVISITFDNETKNDTIKSLDCPGYFVNIPHRSLGKKVQVSFTSNNYLSLDTVVILSEELDINVVRDPSIYGDICFYLWDVEKGEGCSNIDVSINGYEMTSDQDGLIKFYMPLYDQDVYYIVKAPIGLENDTLYMPNTSSTIIKVK